MDNLQEHALIVHALRYILCKLFDNTIIMYNLGLLLARS